MIFLYRRNEVSNYIISETKGEQKWTTSETNGERWKEGGKRTGERHRRSEGGLSVLFARRAVIEYRYSQSRGACRRADAKINEPITEVDSRLLVSRAYVYGMQARIRVRELVLLVSLESAKGSFKTDERATVIRKKSCACFFFTKAGIRKRIVSHGSLERRFIAFDDPRRCIY